MELQKKALEGDSRLEARSEDGRIRFQLQETHGLGENFRPIAVSANSLFLSCDVGRDVVPSVETIFSNQPRFLSRGACDEPRKAIYHGSSISMGSHQRHVMLCELDFE